MFLYAWFVLCELRPHRPHCVHEYVGRVPAPPLDRFIDDIYCLTGLTGHRRMNVPPMPSAHLFVNFGGPVRLWDSDPGVPLSVLTDGWFMGVWTTRAAYRG